MSNLNVALTFRPAPADLKVGDTDGTAQAPESWHNVTKLRPVNFELSKVPGGHVKRGYVVVFAAAQVVGLLSWEVACLLQMLSLWFLSVLLLLPGSLLGLVLTFTHLHPVSAGFIFKLGFWFVIVIVLLFVLGSILIRERRKSN